MIKHKSENIWQPVCLTTPMWCDVTKQVEDSLQYATPMGNANTNGRNPLEIILVWRWSTKASYCIPIAFTLLPLSTSCKYSVLLPVHAIRIINHILRFAQMLVFIRSFRASSSSIGCGAGDHKLLHARRSSATSAVMCCSCIAPSLSPSNLCT